MGRVLLLLNIAQMIVIAMEVAYRGTAVILEDYNPLPTLILSYVTTLESHHGSFSSFYTA